MMHPGMNYGMMPMNGRAPQQGQQGGQARGGRRGGSGGRGNQQQGGVKYNAQVRNRDGAQGQPMPMPAGQHVALTIQVKSCSTTQKVA